MGYYYEFYDPEHNFKKVNEGKFAGMPFYWSNNSLPVEIPMSHGLEKTLFGTYHDPYNCTGLLSRELAIKLQEHMTVNETMFTDLMDENHTDTLIFRIT